MHDSYVASDWSTVREGFGGILAHPSLYIKPYLAYLYLPTYPGSTEYRVHTCHITLTVEVRARLNFYTLPFW
jgi:hypothetical protein